MTQAGDILSVQAEARPGGAVLRCRGRFDALGAPAFDAALAGLAPEALALSVDLSGVDYLSSAGLRGLIKAHKARAARGGSLRLTGASPFVRQVLDQAGLLSFLAPESAPGRGRDPGQDPEAGAPRPDRVVLASGREASVEPLPGAGCILALWDSPAPEALPERADLAELGFFLGRLALGRDREQARGLLGPGLAARTFAGVRPGGGAVSDFLTCPPPGLAGVFLDSGVSLLGAPALELRLEPGPEDGPDGGSDLRQTLADLARAVRSARGPDGNGGQLGLAWFASSGPDLLFGLALEEDGRILLGRLARLEDAEFPQAPDLSECMRAACGLESLASVEDFGPGAESAPWGAPFSRAGRMRAWAFFPERTVPGPDTRLVLDPPLPPDLPWEFATLARRALAPPSPGQVTGAGAAARASLSRLTGGYMSHAFLVRATDREGRELAPSVLKIGTLALTRREEEAFARCVAPFIPNVSPALTARAVEGEWAALRYSFVGLCGGGLDWLEKRLAQGAPASLAALFDRLYGEVLAPWYGQARPEAIRPYVEHDPRRLFPGILDAAAALGLGPDEEFLDCPELGQRLPNPFRFLRDEYPRRAERSYPGARCLTHGDLNPRNVLLDGRDNLFVIDFSETAPRSALADFARMEPILLLDWPGVAPDRAELLRFMERWAAVERLGEGPEQGYAGSDPWLGRVEALMGRLRVHAARAVAPAQDLRPHLLAVLEWTLCTVCYFSFDADRKRLGALLAGLLCRSLERLGG